MTIATPMLAGSRLHAEPARADELSPLLDRTDHAAPSVFRPENMLREARRQKCLSPACVPTVCVLDPDGDIVDHLRVRAGAERSPSWACYHTQMWEAGEAGSRIGVIGSAVGGSFAVLVAEQLFASGCELLISVSSAGQIAAVLEPPCYILVERALRDEGTSHHYIPPSVYAQADPALIDLATEALAGIGPTVVRGATWTTDAPFRETLRAIQRRQAAGLLAVEMEIASLYAFAEACSKPVICLAHVTNQLGCVENDFEKGELNGARNSLELVQAIAAAWRARGPER